ncbi:MAG TPA: cyclopropane-fatty-acyl-phospholipid synthase family protein [Xanthobacteraceae bacterium]|nr:cyclopropane-fatty-acyl-phospholipid synthase family protein [Xanthobacteraceae bacterium]
MTPDVAVTQDSLHRHLAGLPRPAKMALAFASRLRKGRLRIVLPDGRVLTFGGAEPGPEATLIVKNIGFARRLMAGGEIGFSEAYIAGEWDSPDVTRFLTLFCVNHEMIHNMLGGKPLVRLWQMFSHWRNRNTRSGARRNIEAHYDLGNQFYAAWLDPSMTYSSALFTEGANDLESAQTAKYRALAHALDLRPGHDVLEIGCGWGGFAEYAAREHGCRVVGLTLSPAQAEFARARAQAAGLADRIDIRLQDYRDEHGQYDRIASIEMIEAVGETYWPTYFSAIRERLHPGGRAGIQAITIQDHLFGNYRRELDFIRRHIFPGGMLPPAEGIKQIAGRLGLALDAERVFGLDYARTLAEWRDRFLGAWPALVPLGFDERFRRLWEYYLCYCEAGFLSGNIDVRQMIFSKPA